MCLWACFAAGGFFFFLYLPEQSSLFLCFCFSPGVGQIAVTLNRSLNCPVLLNLSLLFHPMWLNTVKEEGRESPSADSGRAASLQEAQTHPKPPPKGRHTGLSTHLEMFLHYPSPFLLLKQPLLSMSQSCQSYQIKLQDVQLNLIFRYKKNLFSISMSQIFHETN